MSDLIFSLRGESVSPAKFVAQTRQFKLVVDEPEGLGGTDESPNPVEYILAGLAGCINVVGHLVAKELNFEIKKLHVEVSGNINADKLFGQTSEDRAGFKNIHLKLIPDTDAGIEVLAQWLRLVQERCPVKDNLANATPVEVSVEKQFAA